MQKLEETLRALGLNQTYTGYENLIKAAQIVMADRHTLYSVTKSIYMPIAEERGFCWSAIERSIRTAVKRAWKLNPELIKTMAGYSLAIQPTAAEFIEMIALYAQRTE